MEYLRGGDGPVVGSVFVVRTIFSQYNPFQQSPIKFIRAKINTPSQ